MWSFYHLNHPSPSVPQPHRLTQCQSRRHHYYCPCCPSRTDKPVHIQFLLFSFFHHNFSLYFPTPIRFWISQMVGSTPSWWVPQQRGHSSVEFIIWNRNIHFHLAPSFPFLFDGSLRNRKEIITFMFCSRGLSNRQHPKRLNAEIW